MEKNYKTAVDLRQVLHDMAGHPLKTLVPPWSWKAAAFAATVRGLAFFATNIREGSGEAMKAFVVEAIFAFITGGLIGAISQQLRKAEPLWATVAVVWIGLPGGMLLAQSGLHHLAHTPHLSGGLLLSFCLSAVSAAFSWYAMRHGAMLGGTQETSISHDLKVLPQILLAFITAAPRHSLSFMRKQVDH